MSEKHELQETKSENRASHDLMQVEESRAISEVKASMQIAQMFPRNINEAYTRIMDACRRKSLAEQAIYTYPRGGQRVEGPSIRLAEAIAQAWGNIQFGVRELSQEYGVSNIEAYAWDVQTNTRQVKVFQVQHKRYTKGGSYSLTDPREIYEITANNGARRMRACILGIIPGDIVDAAVDECRKTMAADNKEPIADRVRKMADTFNKEFRVTIPMIEKTLGHNLDAVSETELVNLRGIYRSLKDGMAQVSQYFEIPDSGISRTDEIKENLKKAAEELPQPEPERKRGRPKKEEAVPVGGIMFVETMKTSLENGWDFADAFGVDEELSKIHASMEWKGLSEADQQEVEQYAQELKEREG